MAHRNALGPDWFAPDDNAEQLLSSPGDLLERGKSASRRKVLALRLGSPKRVTPGYQRTLGQLFQGAGCRKQEALPGNTTETEQCGDLRFEFDPLGHRIKSQRFSERDDSARQFRTVVGVRQAADKGLIDFQDIDRKAVQIRERRIPSAEIVDREPNAERLQLPQPPQVCFRVVHDRAFGQFDNQVTRLETGLLQRLRDVLHQVAMLQVATGDIDGDPQRVTTLHGTAPGAQFTARPSQHPATELYYLAALLSDLDESTRHQHAQVGVPPAHQRLDA